MKYNIAEIEKIQTEFIKYCLQYASNIIFNNSLTDDIKATGLLVGCLICEGADKKKTFNHYLHKTLKSFGVHQINKKYISETGLKDYNLI